MTNDMIERINSIEDMKTAMDQDSFVCFDYINGKKDCLLILMENSPYAKVFPDNSIEPLYRFDFDDSIQYLTFEEFLDEPAFDGHTIQEIFSQLDPDNIEIDCVMGMYCEKEDHSKENVLLYCHNEENTKIIKYLTAEKQSHDIYKSDSSKNNNQSNPKPKDPHAYVLKDFYKVLEKNPPIKIKIHIAIDDFDDTITLNCLEGTKLLYDGTQLKQYELFSDKIGYLKDTPEIILNSAIHNEITLLDYIPKLTHKDFRIYGKNYHGDNLPDYENRVMPAKKTCPKKRIPIDERPVTRKYKKDQLDFVPGIYKNNESGQKHAAHFLVLEQPGRITLVEYREPHGVDLKYMKYNQWKTDYSYEEPLTIENATPFEKAPTKSKKSKNNSTQKTSKKKENTRENTQEKNSLEKAFITVAGAGYAATKLARDAVNHLPLKKSK